MSDQNQEALRPNCTRCQGNKTVPETTEEIDITMGVALGAALGMGFFPATSSSTRNIICPRCKGSGKEPLSS